MIRRLLPMLALMAAAGLVLAACSTTQKSYRAERYDVGIALQSDGSLLVTETVAFHFSGAPFTYVYRDLRTAKTDGIGDIQASMDGTALPRGKGAGTFQVSGSSDIKVQWSFAPTRDSTHVFGLSYRVQGVVQPAATGDLLAWGALPASHAYPIDASRVTLTWPAQAQPLGGLRLVAGTGTIEQDARGATITAQNIPANGELTFEQRYAAGTGTTALPHWQVQQRAANQAALPYVVGSLALALLGSAAWIALGRGTPAPARARDAYQPEQTTLPGKLAPALAGVLIAPGAQPGWAHALAALFDLGRRGVLDIDQTADHTWTDRAQNYTLRLRQTGAKLAPQEQGLIDLLFRDKHDNLGSTTSLADVRGQMRKRWKTFKDPLLDQLRMAGLLDPARERQRSNMMAAGFVLMALSLAVFVAFAVLFLPSGFWPPILLPVALFVASTVGVIVAAVYSPLSSSGAEEAARWRDFATYLRNVARGKTDPVRGDAYEAYLPYAAAFGQAEPWAKAMTRQGAGQIPGWFHALAGAADGSVAFVAMVSAHAAVGASSGGAAAGGAAGGGASGAG